MPLSVSRGAYGGGIRGAKDSSLGLDSLGDTATLRGSDRGTATSPSLPPEPSPKGWTPAPSAARTASSAPKLDTADRSSMWGLSRSDFTTKVKTPTKDFQAANVLVVFADKYKKGGGDAKLTGKEMTLIRKSVDAIKDGLNPEANAPDARSALKSMIDFGARKRVDVAPLRKLLESLG